MIAPAMDVDMYAHPATQHNLQLLRSYGNTILPTDEGFLASGLHGAGRMLEPETIFAHIEYALSAKPLAGKRILISAGPTQEAIDPVRYISNHSTGKMGYAIARQAHLWGAEVVLISGPTALPAPEGVKRISITSAAEMLAATQQQLPACDVLIMAAAVADYTPTSVSSQKIKKDDEEMALPLRKTADILRTLAPQKLPHQQWIGFALETNDEVQHALAKLARKNLDCIVLNSLQDAGAGFAYDTNKITILRKDGTTQAFPLKDKTEVAADILREIR
jgi:phosphopantothenoylcysteine decarboxylase/phosphopantothenate--cysteine ligase